MASHLPYRLGLGPVPHARWSDVFSHAVTLGAPTLIADAFPNAHPGLVRDATLAHTMAVIEAFSSDRIADEQVEATPELLALTEHLRAARDRALSRVDPDAACDAHTADLRVRAAIEKERHILTQLIPVGFVEYEEISLDKQAIGFPPSLALARRLAQTPAQIDHVERLLWNIALGLQFEDDVIDWEDDWRHGGAWAVNLASSLRYSSDDGERPTEPDVIKRVVLRSNVLCMLLERSRRRYRAARRHAQALGAWRLAEWSKGREQRLETLIPLEAQHAGYTVRMNKLAPWAAEVLA